MKKFLREICVGMIIVAMAAVAYQMSVLADGTKQIPYKMVWSDEFNGDALNKDNWNYDIGNGGQVFGWGNNECQYYTDHTDNVRVSDGNLVITAKAEKFQPEGGTLTYRYTSGRVNTKNLQSFKYGKIEARIKVSAVDGLWPAFWMLGYHQKGWPYCGELDILETWNKNQFAQGAVHWVNEDGNRPTSDTCVSAMKQMVNKEEWHIYGITWTPEQIEWTLDGEVFKTFPLTENHKSELKQPFYIILNMAVGGNLPGRIPAEDFVSETMLVDYVRVYQRESDNGSYLGAWSEKEKVASHTVSFKNGSKIVSTQKLLDGETAVLPTVKKAKYKFVGWYNGKKKVTENTRIYSDTILTAKWEKIKVKRVKIASTKQKYVYKAKISGKTDGYQIKIGSKKIFSRVKKRNFKFSIKSVVRNKKTYIVKVRAYILDSKGKKIYGKWSKSKKIKVK